MNTGDRVELPADQAQALIDAGQAEFTTDPVGPALPPNAGGECWRCAGGPQNFGAGVCEFCGAPV